MTYGVSSLDIPKALVLLSSAFHVFMIGFVFLDPHGLIHSAHGGGWWDGLHDIQRDELRYIYPRIWAHGLQLALLVRLNWVLTRSKPLQLYTIPLRCVLLTFVLPVLQYTTECFVYHTLPSFQVADILMLGFPWLALIYNYTKYTREEHKTDASKQA